MKSFPLLLRRYLGGCRNLQLGLLGSSDGDHGLILEGRDPTDVVVRHVSGGETAVKVDMWEI